jgi:KaiC/GvpD/RAD55 family RecA-like ATPase
LSPANPGFWSEQVPLQTIRFLADLDLMSSLRQAFGLSVLDRHLGGGLLPGSLTVVAGATGAGKTQLGLKWANEGLAAEHQRGILCDLTSRGDAQNHAAYAREQFGWALDPCPSDGAPNLEHVWDFGRPPGDYFHPFDRAGRRVTKRDLEPEDWHAWKTDLARVLRVSAAYFYANFVRGSRRVVVDGIEPTERFSESIQFEFFEYLYHQILRKEDAWAARELFRERFLANEPNVRTHPYDHRQIGCLYLYTTPHVLLDDLISEPIGEGDIYSNANTIILMGRTRAAGSMGRALFVAKHRGSACGDRVLSYHLTARGLEFDRDADQP